MRKRQRLSRGNNAAAARTAWVGPGRTLSSRNTRSSRHTGRVGEQPMAGLAAVPKGALAGRRVILERRKARPSDSLSDFAKTHTSVSGIDDSDAVMASDDQS